MYAFGAVAAGRRRLAAFVCGRENLPPCVLAGISGAEAERGLELAADTATTSAGIEGRTFAKRVPKAGCAR